MIKESGILLPIHSLGGMQGIGTLGTVAHTFIDSLNDAHQSYWQVCPIGHTGNDNSPYIARSAFAGNPLFIDGGRLVALGLLSDIQLEEWHSHFQEENKIDYDLVQQMAYKYLKIANKKFDKEKYGNEYSAFIATHSFWLDDYCSFVARAEQEQSYIWSQWKNTVEITQFDDTTMYGLLRYPTPWIYVNHLVPIHALNNEF